jgi:hypothetical protein
MLRRSTRRLHGILPIHLGTGSLPVDGVHITPMIPCNHIYTKPALLRQQLDQDGYLYVKGLVPRDACRLAYADVCKQLHHNKWWCEETEKIIERRDGFFFGAPAPLPVPSASAPPEAKSGAHALLPRYLEPGPLPPPLTPFHLTDRITLACFGPSINACVRQIFGGAADCLNYNTLDIAAPAERHGFYMPAVFMNQGTKLVLTVWLCLHDMPLNVGGIACCRGSNSSEAFKRVRETYGQHDVEAGDVRGDGCITHDPADAWNLGNGECPIATGSFEPGDAVITTVYTLQSFATNMSSQWRVGAQSRWVMAGDDVGPDPRFSTSASTASPAEKGAVAPQLLNWMASREDPKKYPRSMLEARRDWGIAPLRL